MNRFIKATLAGGVLALAAPAHAQFTVEWSSIDGGGTLDSSNGVFSVSGAIGQPDAGPPVMVAGDLEITGGFWVKQPCLADFDKNQVVDVFDLLLYLTFWFDEDPPADIDGIPGVDVFDLLFFLDAWFNGC